MTVAELIEKLKGFDGSLPVWSFGSDQYGYFTHSSNIEVSLGIDEGKLWVWVIGEGP